MWGALFICGGAGRPSFSDSVMSDSQRPHGLQPTGLLRPRDFPGKRTGVGCHFLLQGIFPTQGSNPGLPHCGQILYQLSHKGPVVTRECRRNSRKTTWFPPLGKMRPLPATASSKIKKIWRREWQSTSVFLPGEFHGQRSLMGQSRGFPAAPRQRPREFFFNASRGPSPLP